MMRYFLAIAVVLGVMAGCLPKGPDESPVAPGVEIYNVASTQQSYAVDFFEMASRLNVLLTDARTQGKSNLNEVQVTIDGRDYSLLSVLFGYDTSITGDGDLYIIRYSREANEALRHGEIMISTGGKLWDELQYDAGDLWSVELYGDNPFIYSNTNYPVYVDGFNLYIGAGSTPHSWYVSVTGFSSYFNEHTKSDWTTNMIVTQKDHTGLGYTDFLASRFERQMTGNGKSMNGAVMHYSTDLNSSIIIMPSCSFGAIASGKVNVWIDDAEVIDASRYPSRSVEVEYIYKGNCKNEVWVTYNTVRKQI